jgi:preprotein translocase subunit SecF
VSPTETTPGSVPADDPVHEHGRVRRLARQLYQGTNDFDFTKTFRWGLLVALVVSLLSIALLFTRELNLGIDFEGGGVWEVTVVDVSVEEARDVMTGLGEGGAKIQLATSADGTEVLRVQAGVDAVDRSSDITRAWPRWPGSTPIRSA